jgi:hypothetical protein
LVLRYLTDAYRTVRQTVPDRHRPPELDDLVEWLGETIRQTDSSLLDEWEALADPAHVAADALSRLGSHAPPPPPRPISAQLRPFRVMIRNALWRRVELAARDDVDGLAALDSTMDSGLDSGLDSALPDGVELLDRAGWDDALAAYYAEHDRVLLDADARGPALFRLEETGRTWSAVQVLHDPEGHHDWRIEAVVDLDASDQTGEAVLATTAMRSLGS